jgi:hypothetical protein
VYDYNIPVQGIIAKDIATSSETAFWNAYQSSQKMVDGCGAAIQYAAEHAEILVPLGSDYHGAQSHIYVPVDVCPFR